MATSSSAAWNPFKKLLPAVIFRWGLPLLVSMTPIIMLLILVESRGYFRDFTFVTNDEVSNYHQVLTYKEAGFEGGYYSLYEQVPSASFSHFYTYGPWFSMVYGVLARLIGWEPYSFPILNAVVVIVSLVIFCRVSALDTYQLLLTGVALVSFYGFLLYVFTGFQETFQQSLAVLMAAVFYGLLKRNSQPNFRYWLSGLLLIFFASLTRMSWGLLLLPYFILAGAKTWRGIIVSIALSLGVGLLIIAVWQVVGAPGNNSVFVVFSKFSSSIEDGLSFLWNWVSTNFESASKEAANNSLYVLQYLEILALIVVSMGAILIAYWRRKTNTVLLAESLFHMFNLGSILIVIFSLYIVGGDYRVLAPHLMISLLLLVAFKRYSLLVPLVVVQFLFMGIFVDSFLGSIPTRFDPGRRAQYEEFRTTVQNTIQYDKQAPSAWCNTLLFNIRNYTTVLAGVPGGIGLSFFMPEGLFYTTYYSNYVLLDAANYQELADSGAGPKLELLTTTSLGSLYRNRSSKCEGG